MPQDNEQFPEEMITNLENFDNFDNFDDEDENEDDLLDTSDIDSRYQSALIKVAYDCDDRDDLKDKLEDVFNNYQKIKSSISEVKEDFYVQLDEMIRKRAKEINEIDSTIKQKMEQTNFEDWLSVFFSKKYIADVLQEIWQTSSQPQFYYNLGELFSLKENQEEFLVDDLFRKVGLFLIAAYAKTGKSLFVSNLCSRVLQGGYFLERKCVKSNVLYIQNEEALSDTGKKIYDNGFQLLQNQDKQQYEDLVYNSYFITAKNLDIIADIKRIELIIQKYNIGLVVIDSLGASIKRYGLDEYSSKTMEGLYYLQLLLHDNGCAGVITHHSNKSDNNETHQGKLQGIAGFSGISRANDGIVKLSRTDKNSNHVDIHTIPRSGKPQKITIELFEEEGDYWDWKVIYQDSLSEEEVQVYTNVIKLLKEVYEQWKEENDENLTVYGLTASSLSQQIQLERSEVVPKLNYLARTEGIGRFYSKKFKGYLYHYKENSWLEPYLEREEQLEQQKEELEKMKTLKVHQILACNNDEQIDEVLSKLSKEEKSEIYKTMNAEQKQQFWMIKFPPKFKIDDWVRYYDEDQEIDLVAKVKTIVYPYDKIKKKIKNGESNNILTTGHEYYLENDEVENVAINEYYLQKIELNENNEVNNDEIPNEEKLEDNES